MKRFLLRFGGFYCYFKEILFKDSQWSDLLGVLVESRPSWPARRPSGGGADAEDGGGGGHRYPADKRGFRQN